MPARVRALFVLAALAAGSVAMPAVAASGTASAASVGDDGATAAPVALPAGANTMCPVLTDEPVDPSIWVDYQGRRVSLPSQRCRKKFLEDPTPYLAALEASPRVSGDAPAAPLSGRQRLVRFAGRLAPPRRFTSRSR